jgi:hypothetical protein
MKQQIDFIDNIQIDKFLESNELQAILNILSSIENHTIELRKKIMSEISKDVEVNNLTIKLNDID